MLKTDTALNGTTITLPNSALTHPEFTRNPCNPVIIDIHSSLTWTKLSKICRGILSRRPSYSVTRDVNTYYIHQNFILEGMSSGVFLCYLISIVWYLLRFLIICGMPVRISAFISLLKLFVRKRTHVKLFVWREINFLVKARRAQSPVQCFVARGALSARLYLDRVRGQWPTIIHSFYINQLEIHKLSGNWTWQSMLAVTFLFENGLNTNFSRQYLPISNNLKLPIMAYCDEKIIAQRIFPVLGQFKGEKKLSRQFHPSSCWATSALE